MNLETEALRSAIDALIVQFKEVHDNMAQHEQRIRMLEGRLNLIAQSVEEHIAIVAELEHSVQTFRRGSVGRELRSTDFGEGLHE